MTEHQWAELRQVGFPTLDHAAGVRTATELLALGPGFGDPLLAAMHLAARTAKADNIVAVDVHATDREHGPGRHGELCNTLIRFV
jgi:hypothetical protein